MRFVAATLVLVVAATLVLAQSPNMIRRYLRNNPAVVRQQINCLLNYAPCDANGSRLKEMKPTRLLPMDEMCRIFSSCMAHKVLSLYEPRYLSERLSFRNPGRGLSGKWTTCSIKMAANPFTFQDEAAMPTIVSTNCGSCSPLVSTIVSYIGTSYPQEYQQIRSLYG